MPEPTGPRSDTDAMRRAAEIIRTYMNFGGHDEACPVFETDGERGVLCTCGLWDHRAELQRIVEKLDQLTTPFVLPPPPQERSAGSAGERITEPRRHRLSHPPQIRHDPAADEWGWDRVGRHREPRDRCSIACRSRLRDRAVARPDDRPRVGD